IFRTFLNAKLGEALAFGQRGQPDVARVICLDQPGVFQDAELEVGYCMAIVGISKSAGSASIQILNLTLAPLNDARPVYQYEDVFARNSRTTASAEHGSFMRLAAGTGFGVWLQKPSQLDEVRFTRPVNQILRKRRWPV